VARNPQQNLLRFFWPEPARPAQKRVTADGTLPDAACKEGDHDAVTVRGRICRPFAARYWRTALGLSVEIERDTCRTFRDPLTGVHYAPRFGPRIGLKQA
jgi:hypothetical protein